MNGDVHGPSLFSFCMFFIIYLLFDEDLNNLIARFRPQVQNGYLFSSQIKETRKKEDEI